MDQQNFIQQPFQLGPFIDIRKLPLRYFLTQKLAQRFPPIARMEFEEVFFGDEPTDLGVVPGYAVFEVGVGIVQVAAGPDVQARVG